MDVVGPLALRRTLRPLAHGSGDPTWRFAPGPDGPVARAMWTPEGAATVELRVAAGGRLLARAWGPGAGWAVDRAPAMAGLLDDTTGFDPDLHPVVATAVRRGPGFRLGRGLVVWDVVVPTVLGQRVTTAEAHGSWWKLVWRHGHPSPGPWTVRLPPTPGTVARLGDADWHRIGVERARADAVRGLLRVLPAMERVADRGPSPEATLALRRAAESVRRVGPWTSTGLAAAVTGDPDVVLLGDLHVPHGVCHALAGEARGSDERMLELLEPFRPHRGRVQRILKFSGMGAAPRRGPRYTPLPIAAM